MWRGRDVISILDFSPEELEELFKLADVYERKLTSYSPERILEGRILATAFFEPSTRTKLSFQAAMLRLGGGYIDLPPETASSRAKGENFADTIRMLDYYSDVIVVRHRLEGAARFAAEIADVPIINGGDGTRDHPTQTMIDLYTIRQELGDIRGLTVGVLGDLRYGRAARSFILGVSLFDVRKLFLISPSELRAREDVFEHLDKRGINYVETSRLRDVIGELDVLYITRIQRERFPGPLEYERVRGSYRLTVDLLRGVKENLIILHPLPRVDELDFSVDVTRYARYFKQAKNGVLVRMALLHKVLRG